MVVPSTVDVVTRENLNDTERYEEVVDIDETVETQPLKVIYEGLSSV